MTTHFYQKIVESISSVSSPYSIPSPGVVTLPGGNLLSNLPPPTNLPDFTLWQNQPVPTVPAPTPLPPNLLPPVTQEVKPAPAVTVNVQPFPQTQFRYKKTPKCVIHT